MMKSYGDAECCLEFIAVIPVMHFLSLTASLAHPATRHRADCDGESGQKTKSPVNLQKE